MTESDEDRYARLDRSSSAMEDLAAVSSASNATMLELVQEVRADTEARDKKIDLLERNHKQLQYMMVAVCAAVLVMLALGVVNAFNIAYTQKQQTEIKQFNLTGFYCARTNPSNIDPSGAAFLSCMKRLVSDGPTLTSS